MLKTYALSHRRRKTEEETTKEEEEEEERELLSKDKVDGEKVENKVVFWIDENLNPFTGQKKKRILQMKNLIIMK